MQGYDKYGFWECDALPTPNLQKALSLKVILFAANHCCHCSN